MRISGKDSDINRRANDTSDLISVHPGAVTVLLGADGRMHGPMTEQYVGLGKCGWLSDFSAAGNAVRWEINVPQPDIYELAILGGGRGPSGTLPTVEIAIGDAIVRAELREPIGWRQTIGTFDLSAGKNTVTVQLVNDEPLHMFYSTA